MLTENLIQKIQVETKIINFTLKCSYRVAFQNHLKSCKKYKFNEQKYVIIELHIFFDIYT